MSFDIIFLLNIYEKMSKCYNIYTFYFILFDGQLLLLLSSLRRHFRLVNLYKPLCKTSFEIVRRLNKYAIVQKP